VRLVDSHTIIHNPTPSRSSFRSSIASRTIYLLSIRFAALDHQPTVLLPTRNQHSPVRPFAFAFTSRSFRSHGKLLEPLMSLKIMTVRLPQDNHASNCRECARRSDWDVLHGFYRREEAARLQVGELQAQVTRLHEALQHAGSNAQSDRIALNKSHSHLQELQYGYSVSEAARAKCENQLHEERQEHRLTEEALSQERHYAKEAERNLGWVWSAHARLEEILSRISSQDFGGPAQEGVAPWNIADLLLELEAKGAKIAELETAPSGPQPRLGPAWTGVNKSNEQPGIQRVETNPSLSRMHMTFNTRPAEKKSDRRRRSQRLRPTTEDSNGDSLRRISSEGTNEQASTTVKMEDA